MKTNRREFLNETLSSWKKAAGFLGIAFVLTKCSSTSSTVAPSSSRLQPLDLVVSNNGTSSPPTYYGYADADDNLIMAMRNFGLNPQPIPPGFLGVGSYKLSTPSEFGWIFAVQNIVFGSDATNITLTQDQLWAAYKKLSLG